MKRSLCIGALAVAPLTLLACGSSDKASTTPAAPPAATTPAATPTSPAGTTLKVKLHQQSKSGETGTATLTQLPNGKLEAKLDIKGEPASGSQPDHIHKGTCESLDPNPELIFNNVIDGKSTSTVDTTIAYVQATPHAINVHKSAQDLPHYVACGDIPAASGASGSSGSPTPTPPPASGY